MLPDQIEHDLPIDFTERRSRGQSEASRVDLAHAHRDADGLGYEKGPLDSGAREPNRVENRDYDRRATPQLGDALRFVRKLRRTRVFMGCVKWSMHDVDNLTRGQDTCWF